MSSFMRRLIALEDRYAADEPPGLPMLVVVLTGMGVDPQRAVVDDVTLTRQTDESEHEFKERACGEARRQHAEAAALQVKTLMPMVAMFGRDD